MGDSLIVQVPRIGVILVSHVARVLALTIPKDLLVKVLTLILSHYMEINSIVFGWVLDI